MKKSISYEFPLNEFIRNSLKVDRLLNHICNPEPGGSEYYLRNIFTRVLEIHSLLCRPELKNELIKEVEKKLKRLDRLKTLDNIDQPALEKVIARLSRSIKKLKSIPSESYSKPLPYLVDAIKQRESIPGGQFDFDMPAYKCLLNTGNKQCYNEAIEIIKPYTSITEAITLLLSLLRQSGETISCVAENGFLQVKENINCDMIIVTPQTDEHVYPEISGGKHRIFIRFMTLSGVHDKPIQVNSDINFQMACCHI